MLSHKQYDLLERAITHGTRIAIQRRGRREYVLIPLRLRTIDGQEVVEAQNPITGDDLVIALDDIDTVEVVR